MTNKEARNIANWMFAEGTQNTNSGNWLFYLDEDFGVHEEDGTVRPLTKEEAELLVHWLCKLYPEAILEATVTDEAIDVTFGTWYYANDEDDDEPKEA